VISVQVLNRTSQGTCGQFVKGLEWVKDNVRSTGRPSVVSMSLGVNPPSPLLDSAAAELAAAGIHLVAAAGNDNIDAKNLSPAHLPYVITVGASDIVDSKWAKSNYGSAIDIWAPGRSVISASNETDTVRVFGSFRRLFVSLLTGTKDYIARSGTSMAAPHVAGIISPAAMATKLQNLAEPGVLSGIRKWLTF
jgi:cerevisin